MTKIKFFVPGIPKPRGSKSAFTNKKTGKTNIVDACKESGNWMTTVKVFALQAYRGPLLTGPIRMSIAFYFLRPKSHYRTGNNAGTLKLSAPICHITRPDRTKILRGTEDAMKGIIFKDDSQIVTGLTTKLYGETPGANITIEEI